MVDLEDAVVRFRAHSPEAALQLFAATCVERVWATGLLVWSRQTGREQDTAFVVGCLERIWSDLPMAERDRAEMRERVEALPELTVEEQPSGPLFHPHYAALCLRAAMSPGDRGESIDVTDLSLLMSEYADALDEQFQDSSEATWHAEVASQLAAIGRLEAGPPTEGWAGVAGAMRVVARREGRSRGERLRPLVDGG
ncbi:hypothetical protein [Streptomyces otsuchiensis]|uniref:hypothetical protein n=1 Tax=Streptomyces otsuchiensis TaxID=2681388 RepID=UPI001031104C|nr:hypothetical protein [Streptomyces otsuchiensis]